MKKHRKQQMIIGVFGIYSPSACAAGFASDSAERAARRYSAWPVT